MALGRQEALRLLRFCLGPDDSGSVDLADDGAALVSICSADPVLGVRTFEANSFEAALRQAVDAGMLKATCVERQIAFLAGAARTSDAADAPASASPRPSRTDLFPVVIGAASALLHEAQVERGMSAIFAGSSGRIFRRELARQRERTDARRGRLGAVRRELEGLLGASLGRRFEEVETRLGRLTAGRKEIDAGGVSPAEIVSRYSAVNAELLGLGDGALVAFAAGPHRANALACVVMLYAKEKTGIERARIGGALAARSISDEDRQVLAGAVAARTSYLHVFAATAPRPAEELLERALGSAIAADLARIEGMILDGRGRDVDVDPKAWFALASRKMDLLGEVGGVALGLVG